VGESFVAGPFQSASDLTDFRLMGTVNALHAGDRSYSLSKMSGYKMSIRLRDNYSLNKDTQISKVEGVPQDVKDFVSHY
jgi:hypothetical protein